MKKFKLFGMVCVIGIGLTGCVSKPIENDLSKIRIAKGAELIDGKSEQERAEDIKENIMKMQELEGAAVVVESHTALIGLRVKRPWREESGRLKNEAGQLAKEADTSIEGTSVTTNEKIVKMIESLERQ